MQSEQDQKIKQQIGYQWDNSLNFYLKTNIEGEPISENNRQRIPDFRSLVKDTELLYINLFYKNEVYTERLVEFRIDGLDYYLEQVTKATRQKIIVIRIHKSSDRKWTNTK